MLDLFIRGIILAAIVISVPMLWKLGKQKKAASIAKGAVYYGLLGCRVFLLYVAGVVSAEMILMVLLGDSVQGTIALIMTLVGGLPFAALYTYLYRRSFIKKYLA